MIDRNSGIVEFFPLAREGSASRGARMEAAGLSSELVTRGLGDVHTWSQLTVTLTT